MKKKLWHFSWGYRESFLVAIGLLLVGFVLEYLSGGVGLSDWRRPYNYYAGGLFLLVLIVGGVFLKKNKLVKWLTSMPAAISAISIFSLLVLMMGLLPVAFVEKSSWLGLMGFSHITHSWPFVLIQMYFLLVLGLSVVKRCLAFKIKDIGFLLLHLGLWLVVFGGSFGNGDRETYRLSLQKGIFVREGVDEYGKYLSLPLSIRLDGFEMEEYLPQITFVEANSGTEVDGSWRFDVDTSNVFSCMDWKLKVKAYYPYAVKGDGLYFSDKHVGATHAALVEVRNKRLNNNLQGWVADASFLFAPQALKIDDSISLVLLPPKPKKFSANVRLAFDSGEQYDAVIQVNKPVSIHGWHIYLQSYDNRMGRWSQVVSLELVKDPWLPVVYSGIFMLLAGALNMFWLGKLKRKS